MTSRSPRYYVSAAFWSRDTLLWSFPGLLLLTAPSPGAAAGRLRTPPGPAGEHAHYINGIVLYPGFELDQLAAYLRLKALRGIFRGPDHLEEELIAQGSRSSQKCRSTHPPTGLYATFLDPSDDPVRFPFLIYNNALLERSFDFLGGAGAAATGGRQEEFKGRALALRKAIYRHGIAEGPCGPMFAWAVDGRGQFQLYDNPPGSLLLLAHYGFCSPKDPVFKNTAA